MFRRLSTNLPREVIADIPDGILGAQSENHNAIEVGQEASSKAAEDRVDYEAKNGNEISSKDQDDDGGSTDRVKIVGNYSYFNKKDQRKNEVRNERSRQPVREAVLRELRGKGLCEIFLSGENGTTMTSARPHGPHINILASSPLEKLKMRRHVVVIIGEHTQDLAVWAWRALAGDVRLSDDDDMLKAGSALGLVEKLKDSVDKSNLPQAEVNELELIAARFGEHCFGRMALATLRSSGTFSPGLVVLNPGQLLYSHIEHRNMTQTSWWGRPKANALAPYYSISDTYNRVPGHRNSAEHIITIFTQVLPQLLLPTVDCYVAGIGDGADEFAAYLNRALQAKTKCSFIDRIKGFAATAQQFSVQECDTEAMKDFMLHHSRAWVLSPTVKGTFISDPEPAAVESPASPTYSAGIELTSELIWPKVMTDVLDFFKESVVLDATRDGNGPDQLPPSAAGDRTLRCCPKLLRTIAFHLSRNTIEDVRNDRDIGLDEVCKEIGKLDGLLEMEDDTEAICRELHQACVETKEKKCQGNTNHQGSCECAG